jgi:AcrR family transcriptional regulator
VSVVTRVDPRVRRTHALLHDALRTLADERPLASISVADIAERATVSRATFYLHYADRDELLIDVIDTIITTEAQAASRPGAVPDVISEDTPPPAFMVDFMRDIQTNAAMFRQVLGADGSARVQAHLRLRLQQALQGIIRMESDRRTRLVADDVHAAWLSGALLGVVVHWLEHQPRRGASAVAGDVWRLAIQPGARRS